jgi:hypothetical protein
MKTFKQFILEDQMKMSAFNLPRSQMPQIKDIDSFLSYVSSQGHSSMDMFGDVDDFRPTQTDFDQEKVNRIKYDMVHNPRKANKSLGRTSSLFSCKAIKQHDFVSSAFN